jgi:APA family basic amino acid/polyamine antiporter
MVPKTSICIILNKHTTFNNRRQLLKYYRYYIRNFINNFIYKVKNPATKKVLPNTLKNFDVIPRLLPHSFADGFNLLHPLAVVVLCAASFIAVRGTKRTSLLNWIASIASSLVIVFIIVVGFIHFKGSNLAPYFPQGVEGVFVSSAIVYWAYTGFDMVATSAEETKNPPRDIPIGLVGSMSIISVIYGLMALALTGMIKYKDIEIPRV